MLFGNASAICCPANERAMNFLPFFALIMISWLYRDELMVRALVIYWSLWLVCLLVMISAKFHPGIFTAVQSALAISMLVHVRANPSI
jgi:hypothetical protein